MGVRLDGAVIRLEGDCRLADAEALAALLVEEPERRVALDAGTKLHGAVVQALLALAPEVDGEAEDPFLRTHLRHLLQGARDARTPPGVA